MKALNLHGLLGCQRGFTLLETILSLAIISMVLVLILSSVRLGIRSWEKGGEVVERQSGARFLHARLSREIGSAFKYTEEREGVKRLLFIGDKDSLGFVSAFPGTGAVIPSGGIKWVYYSLREEGLTVREKTVPSQDMEEDRGGNLYVLEPGAKEVSFEYLHEGAWSDAWDADLKEELPEAVRVRVFLKEENSPVEVTVPLGVSTAGLL